MTGEADGLTLFHEHLDQLADDAGVELDDADRHEILRESVGQGFSPEATVVAFHDFVSDSDDDDELYDDEPEQGPERLARHLSDDFARLSAEYGRPLTTREQEIIVHGSLAQAERFDQISPEEALDDYYRANPGERRPDTSTSEGRQEFFRQRMADKAEPAEIDPDRELDLDNQDDRHAFMQARLNGAEFEDAEYAE